MTIRRSSRSTSSRATAARCSRCVPPRSSTSRACSTAWASTGRYAPRWCSRPSTRAGRWSRPRRTPSAPRIARAGSARSNLVGGQLEPVAVRVDEVDRLRNPVVLLLELDAGVVQILARQLEVLAVHTERQVQEALAVARVPEQRHPTALGHHRHRHVAPRLLVLALETQHVAVEALGRALVIHPERDVIEALDAKA